MDLFIPLTKFDDEQRMVYGYASTEALDIHGERITKAAIEEALPEYMRFANIREMHQLSAVGVAKEVELDEKGLYVCAKVVDDAAWSKVKEQVYKGFSVGGKKLEKADGLVTKVRLSEISLVDRPANPECRFDLWKAEGQPSEESPEEKILKLEEALAKIQADHEQELANLRRENQDLKERPGKMENTPETQSGDDLGTSIRKVEETLAKMQKDHEDALAELAGENKKLQDRLAKLEAEPIPPKAALMDLTSRPVAKEDDTEDLRKIEEPDPTDTFSLIKAAHRRPNIFSPRSQATKSH